VERSGAPAPQRYIPDGACGAFAPRIQGERKVKRLQLRGIVMLVLLPCAAALAACGKGERAAGSGAPPDTAKWNGLYVSDTLPGEARPKVMRLSVGPDTVAAVWMEFVGLGITRHPGRWSAEGDVITMQPTLGDGTPNEPALVWRMEGTRLVPVKWDRMVYGERGVTLTRQVLPATAPADTAAGARR
jgi:hypothetical protein